MQQIKWTARKFNFGYKKGMFLFFLERLQATAPRLNELFMGITEVKASDKVNGGWSAKEHVGHLIDLEYLHDGRVDDFITAAPILRAADMSNAATYSADHNQKTIPALLNDFRTVRDNFILRVRNLDEQYFDRTSLHPRLQQSVTLTDILFFMAEHDNHHLLRISEAL